MKIGTFFKMNNRYFMIKEQLHARLFLVEEYDRTEDDYYPTGKETYVSAWELERFAEIL